MTTDYKAYGYIQQNLWYWVMMTIDASTTKVQFMFYNSDIQRWYNNNLVNSQLTPASFFFSDMKLFPGTMTYFATPANSWCTFNGQMKDLFMYFGVTANQYIKDTRSTFLFMRSPDTPFA